MTLYIGVVFDVFWWILLLWTCRESFMLNSGYFKPVTGFNILNLIRLIAIVSYVFGRLYAR